MSKGLVYIIEIKGIKLGHRRAIQTLIVQEHLPHLADWVSCIYGCCALQLANLQDIDCNASAPEPNLMYNRGKQRMDASSAQDGCSHYCITSAKKALQGQQERGWHALPCNVGGKGLS